MDCLTLDQICSTAGSRLYRARRLQDGAFTTLKLLNLADTFPTQANNFRHEYEMLRALDIAGVVKPSALFDEQRQLAMDVGDIVGESFEAILKSRRLDLPSCLRVCIQIADILSALHAHHIIHQDIRPANFLMMKPAGRICLLDVSLAISETQQTLFVTRPSQDAWAYVSPEQTGRLDRPLDYRTDFYSLGVTFYHMLTGQLPFIAHDPLEWAYCHIARVPQSPTDLVPELPQAVADIAMKLLAKSPEDRYQSAHGLRYDLDCALARWRANGRIEAFPLGEEDFSDRFQIPHKLYGRDQETAMLLNAFERVSEGGERMLVTLSGYAGVGKSFLVNTLHRRIVGKKGYFIAGKFDQYLRDTPYAVLAQAFRQLAQQLLAQSEARIADWRREIQQAVGVNGQLIVDVAPQIELIIGKQPRVAELPPLDAKNRLHRVFQQFLGVFARKEHPLVLFLDDLQWVDAASLQLIQYLLTNEDTCALMLIAAYRDNEVDATHPLQSRFTAIRQSGAAVADIQLASLPMSALNQLTADTLHTTATYCAPLTQLIYEKTGGNPFFFTQFLASLQKEGLLRYIPQDKRWHWDTERIGVKDFADTVVNLMVEKLQRLPTHTRKLLQLGACLGNKFDLHQLALVSRMPAQEIEQRLGAAFHEGLIVAIDGACKFLHDRIQQAAYSLISPHERSATHLRIGRALHAALSEEKKDLHLFDIASQFNLGADQLAAPKEKEQVAALNLRAGKKAKASAAYASACVYLAAGMALLEENDWERRYELMFGLWLERASCEFLTGHFDEAEQLITVLLQRGTSAIDLTAAYRLKILLHVVKSENPQAVDSGIVCLRLFGIDLPPHPTDQQVQAEYEIMWRNLGNRPIENLIELPLMTDPDMQIVTNVLSDLINPAVFTDMNFTRLLYCHIVSLSLKHGIASSTAYGYVVLGTLLGSEFHRYHDGYRFARLAVGLVEKHGFIAEQARTYFVMGLAAVWTQPIETALDYGQKAFRTGVETGDLTIACYSWIILTADALFRGTPLEDVWRTSEEGLAFCRKNRFRDVADILISQQQFIKAMQGRTAALSTFNDAQFDEGAFEAQLTAERMQPMCYWYWCMKLQSRFMAGDYAGTLTAAERTKAFFWSTIGQIQTLYYHYYTALAITAVYQSSQGNAQRAWREQLAVHQEQLREWAEIYPPTFHDKYTLVAAEIARIDGRDLDAMRLYQQAIEAAHGGGFIQNEGIAHELAAGFYLGHGLPVAGYAHLAEGRRCFARWGGAGKIAQLEARCPQALLSSGLSAILSRSDAETQLDLLSVAKASQAISGRILLKELIDTLMCIVLENAGAQNGALLIMRNDELKLAAEARSSEQGVAVELHGGQTSLSPLAPASIINYVRRSCERILLTDVEQANPFSSDDYFAHRRPRSILCLPILRRDALLGVLYLENNLVAHAFTPARLNMLELLASQAAISLENALLYEDLHLQEARIRRLVESNIIGVFFWHLNGYIQDANEAFLRLVGYSRQEVLSKTVLWTDLTPPESQERDAKKIEELKRTHSVMPYEKEFFRKDGRRIPALIGATFLEGSTEQGIAFVLDLTEQKQAEARIRHMAHYDSLTGLPNRTLLQERTKQTIAHAHRDGTQLAIFFIDLDHFKHINDSLGHSIGDRLLQMAATRLQQCVRESDSVARLGGDEFVLSAPLPSIHHAALMAEKVLNALHLAFVIERHQLHINASIGIGLYPDDGTDVESLMRAADMAMYHAKEKGRGNYQFFTPALNKVAQQRLEVGNRLCQALARDEFMLYFQPQVNMETGKIFAAEALLRWRQPGGAPMSCGEFISIAEETSAILPIGEWVLAQACERLRQWRDVGHSELRIAVNLSVRQFYQHDLPGVIERLLKEFGVPANAVDLEITESVLLQRSNDNMAILQRLCDMGIQLSIDDFGTGYSSLAYLQRFPIHALKVDQSFVRDIGQDPKRSALVAAIIAMAHSMHLNVLAEGVETQCQAAFLLSHGCLAGQGFYYGKAMPADMFIKMLDEQSAESGFRS